MADQRGENVIGEENSFEDIVDDLGNENKEEVHNGEESKSSGNEDNQSKQEEVLTIEAELEKAKAQADDYYAHLQRLQAEFDNFRKRTQKEKEELSKYASERIVEAMLPLMDNFERAISAAETSKDFDSLAKGVEMIYRQMHNVLSKEGLTTIEAVGKPFDPKLHDAVLQVDSDEHPENTVVEELQKGYYLKDKVLRPSMVKVSR